VDFVARMIVHILSSLVLARKRVVNGLRRRMRGRRDIATNTKMEQW